MIMRNCKKRHTNLSMAWIDYKKAYDMIPHSWIMESLELVGVADNVKKLMMNTMGHWTTELTAGGTPLGKVNIRRGIFQGDTLSPLLFVIAMIPLTKMLRKCQQAYHLGDKATRDNHLLFMDDLKLYGKNDKELESLVNTVRVFSEDINMEFGIDKCAVINLQRGKVRNSRGITLPSGKVIQQAEEGGYKYLGVLETDQVLHNEMKDKIKKEYFSRVRNVLKSKLNGGNTISAINTWAVSLVRYSVGIVNWRKDELDTMDRKTRKLMNLYGALHPQADVDRLYVTRREGGRGMISIRECVEAEEHSLSKYIANTEEELLKAARSEGLLQAWDGHTEDQRKRRKQSDRLEAWENKPLHGQFIRQTKNIANRTTWNWMVNGELKKETEGLLTAAQDQALRTNAIKVKIDKQEGDPTCRMCKAKEESVGHLVSECSKLAQTEYKGRHDKVATAVHWSLCEKYGIERAERWYKHRAEAVVETERVKILWDFNIQTDHVIQHRRPDIVVVEKEAKRTWVIDIAVPGDSRVDDKETEKIDKYQDLAREIRKLWKTDVKVVPIVVGGLGTIPKKLQKHLSNLGIQISAGLLQKTALLGTARILRKVLDRST